MLNISLVGCGRIAKRHSDILGNNKITDARLCAVCDVDESRAKVISKEYNVPHYSDMHDMMAKESVDIVAVLTPSGMHAEHVVQLSQYGKHIIVEKPMALTLEDADNMIKACDMNGSKLFVVKQNRFNVPVQKLREAVESKRFGRLVMGTVRVRWSRDQRYYDQDDWRGTWAMDGGVLTNQASHHIDLLEWMMGDVESVYAISKTALVDIEVEDTALVVLKFRNGALGCIEATTAARPDDLEGSISVLGESGTVVIGGFAVNHINTWKFVDHCENDDDVINKYSTNPPDVYGFGHIEYYNHIVECIKHEKPHLVDGLEGRKSLELICAIYESIETGNEVHLRFNPKLCKLGSNKSNSN